MRVRRGVAGERPVGEEVVGGELVRDGGARDFVRDEERKEDEVEKEEDCDGRRAEEAPGHGSVAAETKGKGRRRI